MGDEDQKENVNNDEMYGCRRLRNRCRSKTFNEDTWLVSDDECEMGKKKAYYMSYNLPDKLKNPKYADHGFVKKMSGYNFNTEYLDRNGFLWPVLIKNKYSLGLKVPDTGFNVSDVRRLVGSDRVVDVIDVQSQKDVQLSMKDYQRYYENPDKDRLYNIISLEFSHTKLAEHVMQPVIVHKLDWVDLYWPKSLKSKQMDSTNNMKNMMYPKVQKYCLMSVKGCYTDFHVDFGGTSVWYHILKGVKVFWLIPPTEENLTLYRNWLLFDKRLDHTGYTFLGDVADQCERVVLKAGQTFFIPSGWLHAVYTPKDSIVFGGNFLHTYSIDMQIRISRVEDDTRVTKKFRYPYFTEMHWYALNGIVRRLLRVLDLNAISDDKEGAANMSDYKITGKTARLLRGMKSLLDYLNELPDARKDVPEGLQDHSNLLNDAQFIFKNYVKFLDTQDNSDETYAIKSLESGFKLNDSILGSFKRKFLGNHDDENVVKKYKPVVVSNRTMHRKQTNRRRRTRCRTCEACSKDDCGSCIYCKDMVKYGGHGRAKQSCILRQCLSPVLPSNSVCNVCNRGCNTDEKSDEDAPKSEKNYPPVEHCEALIARLANLNTMDVLVECAICYEIVHPGCLFGESKFENYDVASSVNNDLPNSWKCPKCFVQKHSDEEFFNKQRFFKARSKVLSNGKPVSVKDQEDQKTSITH